MKVTTIIIIAIAFLSNYVFSQGNLAETYKNESFKWADSTYVKTKLSSEFWRKNDLSDLILSEFFEADLDSVQHPMVGVLSEAFQRFEFLIEKVYQDEKLNNWYYIHGKTTHLGVTRLVSGTIKFNDATLFESQNNVSAICLTAEFKAKETEDLPYTGDFLGTYKIIIVEPIIENNELDYFPDDQFYESGAEKAVVGTWTERDGEFTLPFAIGFDRIPYQYAPNFDLGAGEMCINKKYAETWFDYSHEEWKAILKEESDCLNVYNGRFVK